VILPKIRYTRREDAKTMHDKRRWVIVILLLCAAPSVAQQPTNDKVSDDAIEKPSANGTVTGHVFLSDTKRPARKATVYLEPVATLLEDKPNDHGHSQVGGGVTIGVETRFDGSFSFSHLAAGSYYVIASYPGYVSPYVALSLAEDRSQFGPWQPLGPSQESAKELVLKTIPQIAIESGQPVTVDVSLERGAAISGNISYDDGTPATGFEVTVLVRMIQDGKETWAPIKPPPNSRGSFDTDDRGNYRITGLPARKYIVQAMLSFNKTITYISSNGSSGSGTNGGSFTIYSGSTLHLKDAASFAIDLGEERTGENLRIPLSKLHTITGNIVSAHDGHVVNSGQVYLFRSDDSSYAGSANLSEDDPDFTFNFIYEGEYSLSSPMSADVDYQVRPPQAGSPSPPQYDGHLRQLYGAAGKHLHVDGDMLGVTLAVPGATQEESKVFRDALQQQEQQNQASSPK
jgi:hypothetical protein